MKGEEIGSHFVPSRDDFNLLNEAQGRTCNTIQSMTSSDQIRERVHG
jgi:hypothetical protein